MRHFQDVFTFLTSALAWTGWHSPKVLNLEMFPCPVACRGSLRKKVLEIDPHTPPLLLLGGSSAAARSRGVAWQRPADCQALNPRGMGCATYVKAKDSTNTNVATEGWGYPVFDQRLCSPCVAVACWFLALQKEASVSRMSCNPYQIKQWSIARPVEQQASPGINSGQVIVPPSDKLNRSDRKLHC